MKKLLLVLALIISTSSYSQLDNMTIKNIITINGSDHFSSNPLTVPNNKLWVITYFGIYDSPSIQCEINNSLFPTTPYIPGKGTASDSDFTLKFFLPGTVIYFYNYDDRFTCQIQIWEYDAPSSFTGALSFNDIPSLDNKFQLFPNPTDSKITLNSKKDYDIEVFDMTGKIVMKTNGNSIDMSILSNAMYLVKVVDKINNETTSYKVVKNNWADNPKEA